MHDSGLRFSFFHVFGYFGCYPNILRTLYPNCRTQADGADPPAPGSRMKRPAAAPRAVAAAEAAAPAVAAEVAAPAVAAEVAAPAAAEAADGPLPVRDCTIRNQTKLGCSKCRMQATGCKRCRPIHAEWLRRFGPDANTS